MGSDLNTGIYDYMNDYPNCSEFELKVLTLIPRDKYVINLT